MFGEIAKTFGSNFLMSYFFPASTLVFLQLFIHSISPNNIQPVSDRMRSGIQILVAMSASQLAASVLLAATIAVVFQMFQSAITKLYEGYYRTTLVRFGGALVLISLCGRWLTPNAATMLFWVASWSSVMLLSGIVQIALVRWHRSRFSLLRQEIGQLGPDDPKRLMKEFQVSRLYPPYWDAVLPTRFGNIIRAFEYHPQQLYSIDPITSWPRLISVIPDSYQRLLEQAEFQVYSTLNLSLVFGVCAWQLTTSAALRPSELACVGALCSALIAFFVYLGACPKAANWGEVVRGAFDLYRHDLLLQLGVVLPKTPITLVDEQKLWRLTQRVTYYLEDPGPSLSFSPTSWAIKDATAARSANPAEDTLTPE